MSKENIKLKKGFTIIETVLVLAIAGLIMALVFLALPALQTGQRDQARKQDVNNVSVALASYLASNNSNYPSAADYDGTQAASRGTGAATSVWTTSGVAFSAQTKAADGTGQVSVINTPAQFGVNETRNTVALNPNTGWVWVVKGTLCPTDAGAQSDTIKLLRKVGDEASAAVAPSRYSTVIELEGANKAIYCVNN